VILALFTVSVSADAALGSAQLQTAADPVLERLTQDLSAHDDRPRPTDDLVAAAEVAHRRIEALEGEGPARDRRAGRRLDALLFTVMRSRSGRFSSSTSCCPRPVAGARPVTAARPRRSRRPSGARDAAPPPAPARQAASGIAFSTRRTQ
jgi:hypothetical protein